MARDFMEILCGNSYPGRGILIGCSHDGKRSLIVYFIMGRSENSRNRVFERTSDGIRTAAFNSTKLTDPSLIIYHPVRVQEARTIVTNGDQTDTIADNLNFNVALRTREFEPDPPNYTPRISGILEQNGAYALSILKTMNGDPEFCQRNFYEFSGLQRGIGHFISTYKTDGDPLPSFEGEPIAVDIADSAGLEAFAYEIWNALDGDNKVSLYAREQHLETGESNDLIINKHKHGDVK